MALAILPAVSPVSPINWSSPCLSTPTGLLWESEPSWWGPALQNGGGYALNVMGWLLLRLIKVLV